MSVFITHSYKDPLSALHACMLVVCAFPVYCSVVSKLCVCVLLGSTTSPMNVAVEGAVLPAPRRNQFIEKHSCLFPGSGHEKGLFFLYRKSPSL